MVRNSESMMFSGTGVSDGEMVGREWLTGVGITSGGLALQRQRRYTFCMRVCVVCVCVCVCV